LVVVEGCTKTTRHPHEEPLRFARFGKVEKPLFDLFGHVEGVAVARSFRSFADDKEGAAIFLRDKLGRDELEKPTAREERGHDNETGDPREANDLDEDPSIEGLQLLEHRFHGT